MKNIVENTRLLEELRAAQTEIHRLKKQVNSLTAEVDAIQKLEAYNCSAIERDITEQRYMEKELTRLYRTNLVGEMAAGIAHEIRNPLTTVRGFVQLLEEKDCCLENREYYSLMLSEVDKANAIISEYLTLAKNKHVEFVSRNLNTVIGRLTQLINTESVLKDKQLVIDLEAVDDILMDEKEISQLLLHLIRNGFEATNSGGKVTVHTYTESGDVVLTIADNGYGIKPYLVEKIGLPFLTTKDNGPGLGLAVCYSIASRHNATINFNTGLTGTTFYVRFKKQTHKIETKLTGQRNLA